MNRPGPELTWYDAKRSGLDAVRHPRWFAAFVKDQLNERHISAAERKGVMPGAMAAYLRTGDYQDQLSVTWEDFTWIRDQWSGPIVVKGILSFDDARRAIDVGASAIVVSNHGALGMDALRLDPVSSGRSDSEARRDRVQSKGVHAECSVVRYDDRRGSDVDPPADVIE